MRKNQYWADNYLERKLSVEEAVKKIKPGYRIFIGSSCGEPQYLINELIKQADNLSGIEIVRMLSVESSQLSLMSKNIDQLDFNIRSFYPGSAKSKRLEKDIRFITPVNLSAVPHLFKTKMLPINVALIQVTPPDDFGWMSLGVSVDITISAAMSAEIVIAQVNKKMPRVLGRSFIHVNDIDCFVEHNEKILEVSEPLEFESANKIGKIVAKHIEDGSTIHITPGLTPQSTLLALSEKNDLGVHTEYLTDGIMRLVSKGVITNKIKGNKNGRLVASSAIGSELLYDFMHDNPSIDFQPSDYVNNPLVISKNNKMVSMNVAMSVDLTGQVASDAFHYNFFTGLTGMLDFNKGAFLSKGGKPIVMMVSTNKQQTKSRIIPLLKDNAVVIPRAEVHYVVTEYGVVNLFGKSIQERAVAMISIAHPDFREELFIKAKQKGLIGQSKSLKESMKSVYPVSVEEKKTINNTKIFFRPIKTVDERRLKEHYYGLEKKDVVARFFHEKKNFRTSDIEPRIEIDYVNNLTIVAITGDFGFGKIIAVGEYYLNKKTNMAEIAFSVNKEWQGRGLSKIVLNKLRKEAELRGFRGVIALTSPMNKKMIKLFNNLPYEISTQHEEDCVVLNCYFDKKE